MTLSDGISVEVVNTIFPDEIELCFGIFNKVCEVVSQQSTGTILFDNTLYEIEISIPGGSSMDISVVSIDLNSFFSEVDICVN